MTVFRAAAEGVRWMLLAQLLTSGGQFFYAALTSRVFSPLEFGSFAAALSLQGLLTLLTTTGLPSYVLKADRMTRRVVRRIRAYAILGGAIAALIFLVASMPWLSLLNAQSGVAFIPLLALAQGLGPLAAVESALLRRAATPRLDATSLFVAFIIANGSGAILLLLSGELWTLASAPALYPIALFTTSALLNRSTLDSAKDESTPDLLSFSRKITLQNVVFLILQQAPGWLVSARVGAESLGFFSRAGTLTGMPATAMATAINRSLQPHWRKLRDSSGADRATRETIILASALAFPVFGLLVVHAQPITELWLGGGWNQAADFVPFLAVAYGISIPFTVLASSAEMRGLFGPVRKSQVAMVIGLLPGLAMLIFSGNTIWAVGAMAASQACGFITLILTMPWSSNVSKFQAVSGVLKQVLLAAVTCGIGWSVGQMAISSDLSWLPESRAFQMAVGILATLVAWISVFRWNAARTILMRRGMTFTKKPTNAASVS